MFGRKSRADWAGLLLGTVMIIPGGVLAIGGVWLIAVGGSWCYLPTGIGLTLSGALITRRRAEGAWSYFLVFLLTLVWAVWEAGPNSWALVPRTLGPVLLL